jgi:hypothetical protein
MTKAHHFITFFYGNAVTFENETFLSERIEPKVKNFNPFALFQNELQFQRQNLKLCLIKF